MPPLERFLELASACLARRRWYQDVTVLYHTASAGLTLETPAHEVVDRIWDKAERCRRKANWTSPLRQDIRFLVAAALVRENIEVNAFLAEVTRARELLRKTRLPQRNSVHALIATLICLERSPDRRVETSTVERMARIYSGFRADHSLLTSADDLPAAALLATTTAVPGVVSRRVEAMYRALRDERFAAGGQLQRASQFLYFAPLEPTRAAHRFKALWSAFGSRSLFMHQGDYDEVALLCLLEERPSDLAAHVVAHRDEIRTLRPRPSKDTAFSLACTTTFLELAPATRPLGEAHALLHTQGILQARQAASIAASGGLAATS